MNCELSAMNYIVYINCIRIHSFILYLFVYYLYIILFKLLLIKYSILFITIYSFIYIYILYNLFTV